MKDKKIGIVGVGLMGHGIATNIQKAGWQIGFLDLPGNQPVDHLTDQGAQRYHTGAALAAASDIVIICVPGSPQVEDIMQREDGVLRGICENALIIDCSTSMPTSTKKLAQRAQTAGARFMDAPMTRTPKEAAEGRLNLIVGGDKALFDDHLPLLRAFAENISHAGEVGSGHMMKLLHNFVSLGFSAVLAEAAACSQKAGIDPEALHSVLAAGGGAGVILDRLAPFILNQDTSSFRFSLAKSLKDIDYYTSMSSDLGASTEVAQAVHGLFSSQVEAGHGEQFVPKLIDLLGK